LLGTNDDFVLETRVNGAGNPWELVRNAFGGDTVSFTLRSPSGALAAAFPYLLAEVFPVAQPPFGNALVPAFHLDAGLFIAFDGVAGGTMIGSGLTATFTTAPGLSGFVARLQAFAVSPAAKNGLYGLTDAHDLVLH
jgi:hypothetical protein